MIKRNWKLLFIFISQIADISAIWLAGSLIFSLKWSQIVSYVTPSNNILIGLAAFTVIHIAIASMMGLYRGSYHLSLRLQNLITIRAFIVSVMIAFALNSLSQIFIGKKSILTFAISLPILLLAMRFLLNQLNLYFQRLGYGVHNSLIVGTEEKAQKIFNRFSLFPELGYKIKGFIVKDMVNHDAILHHYHFDELEKIIDDERIDRIFIPTTDFVLNGYSRLKTVCERKKVKVKIISPHAEDLLKVSRVYDIAGITLTSFGRRRVDKIKAISKRIFDLILSSIIIIMLSPIFIVTIVAIFVESGRPIFFMQRRAAVKGAKEFSVFKFRSMTQGAEKFQDQLLARNETDKLFKMKNDPRITRVGKIIRKLSIDELPQLFNVFIGDMSLVGPRPISIVDFNNMDETDEYWEIIKDRDRVKTGMTGLWQISGRSDIKFNEMILLDLYYVENHSLLFDLEIMFETVPVVLFGRGAY